jgi:hypothetical protein
MKMLTSAIKILTVITLFIIGFFFSELTTLIKSHLTPPVTVEESCQLSSNICAKSGVQIRLERDVLTPLEPSAITVNWPNSTTENIIVSLEGLDMSMGKPLFQLHRTTNQTYEGEILLPICTQNTMTWVGSISNGSNSVPISLKVVQ